MTLRNQRIADILGLATGKPTDAEPSVWYRWWYDYNDYPYPQERPVIARTNSVFLPNNHSCFLAGTLVTTWQGKQAIETIRVGDLVLAQDVASGALAFKPVLGTTLGPPTTMLAVRIGGATLHLTRGHPIWVDGRGWQMAKELKTSDRIHSLVGSLTVDGNEPWGSAETHNLIVSDFNTYFVSDRQVLVHDVTQRTGTNEVVPGLEMADVPLRP